MGTINVKINYRAKIKENAVKVKRGKTEHYALELGINMGICEFGSDPEHSIIYRDSIIELYSDLYLLNKEINPML
ncbi:MAG: hypothetical protein L3J56_00965 [Bacteroidales bacterium]|nr:hypothetical protein [Bacteroidales bacterium]